METFNTILEKISHNPNALRTNSVIGYYLALPKIGERFEMVSKSLTEGLEARLISTSPVSSITKIDEKVTEFTTLNSRYRITKI